MSEASRVGELIYTASIAQFNPLRLPTAAPSPEFCEASLWGGGGRVGVLRKHMFKDEFANSTRKVISTLTQRPKPGTE